MREIAYIAVHCTGASQLQTVDAIRNYWVSKGWKKPGYHYIVKPDGEAVKLLDVQSISNGVFGFNHECVNICYIGGVSSTGKPMDNRTDAQKETLLTLLKEMRLKFPKAIIQGHCDFPMVTKACPSFNAKKEYENI